MPSENELSSRSSILIQLRKLREGILSSSRRDAFAVRIFELSLLLASTFDAPNYIPGIASHLLTLYPVDQIPEYVRALAALHNVSTVTPKWTKDIMRALRQPNLARVSLPKSVSLPRELERKAIESALNRLCARERTKSWTIVRVAYRELCETDFAWLARLLALGKDTEASRWLSEREEKGEAVKAERNGKVVYKLVKPAKVQ